MDEEKAFLVGVLIGLLGNLIPDLPTSAQLWNERPQYRPHIAITYAVMFVALVLFLMELGEWKRLKL